MAVSAPKLYHSITPIFKCAATYVLWRACADERLHEPMHFWRRALGCASALNGFKVEQ
jgi:hypothetical protein